MRPTAVSNREWAFRAAMLRGAMLDVSIGGVAFALDQPVVSGSVLEVELQHPQRRVSISRRACVVGHQPYGETGWKIFCRFVRPLSFEEVSRLSLEPTV